MYKLTNNGYILRTTDGAFVPVAEGNIDYKAYLAWVDAGNTADPVDPLPAIPIDSVTMRQARLALLSIGKLSSVDSIIASLPSPQKEMAEIEWNYSSRVERNNGLIPVLGPMLGLSNSEIDDLFSTAATL